MTLAQVAWLHHTPVKGTALHAVGEVMLDRTGVAADRRFLFVDDRDHLVNGKRLGRLVQLHATWAEQAGELTLRLPDGTVLSEVVRLGEPRAITMYGGRRRARPVLGDWSAAVSAWAGMPLHLMQPDPGDGLDRTGEAGATLAGVASLQALAATLGVATLDARRFRMLIGIEGLAAYAEDAWLSRRIRVGAAVVLVRGNVGRCAVTTQDPDSGRPDLQTLHALERSRGDVASTEPLPFGVWAEVIQPGRVALGDPCDPLDP